jgi:hypothetical protein
VRLYDRRLFRAGGLGGVFRRNSLGIKRIGGKNAPDGHSPFYVNHFCKPFSKREKPMGKTGLGRGMSAEEWGNEHNVAMHGI